jgi:CheY-like chemotaxis protein
MEHPALRGRSILVVENELLIAMDIAQALESTSANVTMTTTVRHALIVIRILGARVTESGCRAHHGY